MRPSWREYAGLLYLHLLCYSAQAGIGAGAPEHMLGSLKETTGCAPG